MQAGDAIASSEPVDGFDAEIGTLYVLPEVQGQGLGERLLRVVSVALRAKGFEAAWLRVLSENAPARRFYERLGAEIKHFYGWRDLTKL